jgi:hypothetical protein
MFFSKSSNIPNSITLNLSGIVVEVEVVKEFILLGCTIDNDLSFSTHVDILKKTVLQKLYLLLKNCSLSL